MIRSLTFSRSKWSLSSTLRACSRSRLSSVYVAPRQRQDPLEVGADDAVLGRGRRQPLEPRRARGRRPSARPPGRSSARRAARAARSTSACSGSPSPSSCWIAFSCWRRKYSRWPFSISDCTCDWIFEPSSNTSSSRLRIAEILPQALLDVDRLEDLLALLGLDRAQRRGDEVRERARVVDVRRGELQLLGQVRREPDDAREQPLDVARQRLDLGRLGQHVGQRRRTRRARYGSTSRCAARAGRGARPWTRMRSVPSGTLIILWTSATRADLVDVVPAGRLDRRVARGHEREQPVAGDDVVDQPHRALLPDRERRHRLREDDRLLERQHRQRRRQLDAPSSRRASRRARTVTSRHARHTSIVTRPRSAAPASATGSVDRQHRRARSSRAARARGRRPRRAAPGAGTGRTRSPSAGRRARRPSGASARPRRRGRARRRRRERSAGRRPAARRRRSAACGSSVWKQSTFGRKPCRSPEKRGTCQRSAKSSSISSCSLSTSRRVTVR